MKHKFLLIISWFVRNILIFFPDNKYIMRFRGLLYTQFMPKAGRNFQVSANPIIYNLEKFYVGNNVQIGAGAIMLSGVTIGDNVVVGTGTIVRKNIPSNCIVAGVPAQIIRTLDIDNG